MNRRIDVALSSIVTICAVLVAVTFVYDRVFATKSNDDGRPEHVKGWDRLMRSGLRIGSRSAPVQIVEFGDFQCPYCKKFHETLLQVMEEHPDELSLVYVQYPLPNHRFADPAARAAECAAAQGRFPEIAKLLFEKQDSLGLKSWGSYARSAGIVDTTSFVQCTRSDRTTDVRLAADRALVAEYGIRATPTVLINGWRLRAPPAADSLKHIVVELIAGRSPFPRRR